MKKLLAIFCASALVLVMLAGCSNTNPLDLPHTNELVIYLPPYSDLTLTPAIDRYRKLYPDVNVIIEDFTNTEANVYSDRLSAELTDGNGPDIVFPSYMWHADNYMLADSGAFMDLNEFIKNDKSFNLDDYVKPVLDGGIYNGYRYIMPYSYLVSLYVSIPEKLDEIGFDISETGDTVSFLNEVVRTMPKAQANPHLISMFDCNILWDLIHFTSGVKLADYESSKALPDEEGLKKLLDAYKPYYDIDSNTPNATLFPSDLQSGKFMFTSTIRIQSFIALAGQSKAMSNYQIGIMPGMDGKTNSTTTQTVAIRSGSPNQLNSWNFIKVLLWSGFQSSNDTIDIPVHIRSISAQFDRLNYDYENYGAVGISGMFIPLSKDEKQAYIDMITNVDYCQVYNPVIARWMFYEHMEPYLKDEISYEDAIVKLKNDLALNVSE